MDNEKYIRHLEGNLAMLAKKSGKTARKTQGLEVWENYQPKQKH